MSSKASKSPRRCESADLEPAFVKRAKTPTHENNLTNLHEESQKQAKNKVKHLFKKGITTNLFQWRQQKEIGVQTEDVSTTAEPHEDDLDQEVANTNSNVAAPATPAFVSLASSTGGETTVNPYEYVQMFNFNDPAVASSFQQFYNSVYVQAYYQAYNDIFASSSTQNAFTSCTPSPFMMMTSHSPMNMLLERCESVGIADTPFLPEIQEETSDQEKNPLNDRPVSTSPTFSKLQHYSFKMSFKGMTHDQLQQFLKLVEAAI
jgi:hypothetical protein